MEAVIGFFSCQNEDLSDACPIDLVRVVFQKAPPEYSIRRFMPRDCQLGWDSVMHIHIFLSEHLVSNEHCEALLVITIMWHDLSW
jgi:hypothetical protein